MKQTPNVDAFGMLYAFRNIVIAGEEAGWDIGDNATTLNNARDAYAALAARMADELTPNQRIALEIDD